MENDKSQRPNNHSADEKNQDNDGRSYSNRDKKPRFNDDRGARRPLRATRPSRPHGARPSFEGRESREGDDRKPRFERNDDRPRRPRPEFGDRDRKPRSDYGDAPRKPHFAKDGERSFRDDRPRRDFGDKDRAPRRDFGDRERAPRKDFGDRDRAPRRDFGDRDRAPRKDFGDRDRAPRRDFGDRDRAPRRDFGDRDRAPRRDFGDRDRAPRRDFGDRDRAPRRDFGDRDRAPRRDFGDRDRAPRRDFGDRDRAPRRDFGDRDRAPRRDFGDRDRAPRRDSRDFGDRDRRPRFEDRDQRHNRNNYNDRPYPSHDEQNAEQPLVAPQDNAAHLNVEDMGYTEFGYAYSNTSAETLKGVEQSARPEGMQARSSENSEFDAATQSAEQGEEQSVNRSYGDTQEGYGSREFSRDDSRPRFQRDDRDRKRPMKRPPLRETIMNMDKDLLKMLARRCNILDRMRSKAGQMAPKEEKELRASWEKAATQMTRDPRIIHQLFALMQEIIFSAKPEEGQAKRTGFNLAPPQLPVDISMFAPLASRRSRLFLALAGASGSACTMGPSLLDDATIECIKMFNQCATSLAWDDQGTLISRQGGGLSLPDKVIYVGDDIFNFFLLLGHYVSKNTRAKFTGEASLKEADLTAVRSFLPQLGARLSNVMPNGSGFPIRLECSGIFEDRISIPADIPADMVLGLFMAAPFWDQAISFEMRARQDAEAIMEEALSVLEVCGAQIRREGSLVHFVPCPIKTPAEPELGMDLQLAAYLLTLPLTLGGKIQLKGSWPECAPAKDIENLWTQLGLHIEQDGESICTSHAPLEPIVWRVKARSAAEKATAEDSSMQITEGFSPDENVSDAAQSEATLPEDMTSEAVTSEEMPETSVATEEATAEEAVAEDVVTAPEISEEVREEIGAEMEEVILEHLSLPTLAIYQDTRFTPLLATCAYLAAVRKKYVILPKDAPLQDMESFFNHLGYDYSEDDGEGSALVPSTEYHDPQAVWTAPTPAWALAYALCAAAHPHIKLSNPGIMTTLYPQFWNLYNALPSFDIKKNVTENKHDKPVRRRIIAADQEGIGSGDSND